MPCSYTRMECPLHGLMPGQKYGDPGLPMRQDPLSRPHRCTGIGLVAGVAGKDVELRSQTVYGAPLRYLSGFFPLAFDFHGAPLQGSSGLRRFPHPITCLTRKDAKHMPNKRIKMKISALNTQLPNISQCGDAPDFKPPTTTRCEYVHVS